MAEKPRPVWLAMTTFDDHARLGGALASLDRVPVGLDGLCLVGQSTAMIGMHQGLIGGEAALAPFSPLFTQVEPMPFVDPESGLVATADRLMTRIKKGGGARPTPTKCWLPAEQRVRLLDGLGVGRLMLLVCPGSAEGWTQSSRTLLKHSAHPVQSYEFPTGG